MSQKFGPTTIKPQMRFPLVQTTREALESTFSDEVLKLAADFINMAKAFVQPQRLFDGGQFYARNCVKTIYLKKFN